MQELRSCSTRAVITRTRFTNHYEWGSFKGNPSAWMERYFDAFLYFANWGTRELMLRLPRRLLDLATAQAYCGAESAAARAKGEHVILEFRAEDESGTWIEEWIEEEGGDGTLASLVPLRADIAGGDLRALYLGWLLCAQAGELDEDEEKPPCPPGLGQPTAALKALVDFLRIGRDLLAVAAAGSAEAEPAVPIRGVKRWVAGLPDTEKTTLLVRLIEGEAHLRAELVRRLRESRATSAGAEAGRRTVGELLAAGTRRAEERRRREAERAALERAKQEREAAEARERYLGALGQREAEMWQKVDALVATKQPGRYDEAVRLLKDLRDVATRAGRQVEAETRLARLREQHAKKPSFLARLKAADL
jgi:hypothetical protein